MHLARTRLRKFLPLQAEGYACTSEQLLDVLLAVSLEKQTLEQVAADLHLKVGAETLRGYLNEQLRVENLSEIEEAVNLILQESFAADPDGQFWEVAIDFHDQAYYGKSEQAEGKWVGGQAKAGTTKMYRVATAYLIKNGQRLTLAIKFVLPDESVRETLEYLLKRLKSLKLEISCLYLDRGFGNLEVAKYLQEIKQRAIVACPIRGKTGGLKALCLGRTSYRTRHIFKSLKHGTGQIEMAMFKGFTTTTKKGVKKRKAKWLAYMLIEADENLSAKTVKKRYRKRFGIESSYRCAKKVRGWTTSPNAAYRFLLLGMSFLLTNIWQEIQSEWTRKRQVGRKVWEKGEFRLQRMVNFLRKAIENCYGMVSEIEMRN